MKLELIEEIRAKVRQLSDLLEPGECLLISGVLNTDEGVSGFVSGAGTRGAYEQAVKAVIQKAKLDPIELLFDEGREQISEEEFISKLKK